MILHAPFEISSRLMPALEVSGATIQLEYDGSTHDGRTRYRWTIDLPDGSEHTGSDLASGVGGGTLQEGFSSLLSFLAAAAESYDYRQRTGREGDNESLFPPAVVEWASSAGDELAMLAFDIEESEAPLIEED